MIVWSVVGIILLIAADQFTKALVVAYIKPNGPVTVVDGVLQMVYVENRGAAFGLMQNMRWFFVILTILACMALLYILFFYKHHDFFSRFACVLIIAGGIGNMIDRIKLSFVVDFISVSFFPPVFNFADCCIVVGVAAAILFVLRSEWKGGKKEKGANSHEQNHSGSGSGE